MATLNKKSGNLRGVEANIQIDSKDWKSFPVQGWVISGNGKLGFTTNVYYDDALDIEFTFSKASLVRMLRAINEYLGVE